MAGALFVPMAGARVVRRLGLADFCEVQESFRESSEKGQVEERERFEESGQPAVEWRNTERAGLSGLRLGAVAIKPICLLIDYKGFPLPSFKYYKGFASLPSNITRHSPSLPFNITRDSPPLEQ